MKNVLNLLYCGSYIYVAANAYSQTILEGVGGLSLPEVTDMLDYVSYR